MKINKIKGTNDFFGNESIKFRYIEKTCSNIVQKYGYREIITPMFEATEVFLRSVGEGSDIVNKEMYTFNDRGNRSLTLRPEVTAGVMRAVIENKLYVNLGLQKYYYCGPSFRYERPGAGRLRQFSQFGVEAIGEESPYLDADIIRMAMQIFDKLGLFKIKLYLNTIGSGETREKYINILKDYFSDKLDNLCSDCHVRYQKNTLRMLDCKIDNENDIIVNAPKITNCLTEKDIKYFETIGNTLTKLNIPFEINPKLVRGLDYYSNDVFEFVVDDENSSLYQMALGGGGRYNNLSEEFDGPNQKSIGFAFGLERIMILLDEQKVNYFDNERTKIGVINIGEDNKSEALRLVNYLRDTGFEVLIDYQNSNLKPQFKMCERNNVKYIIIIGDDEIKENKIKIKDVTTSNEVTIEIEKLNEYFNIERSEKYAYENK